MLVTFHNEVGLKGISFSNFTSQFWHDLLRDYGKYKKLLKFYLLGCVIFCDLECGVLTKSWQ